MGKDFL